MSTKIKITTLLETSDHDGYCSGDECYYESEEKVFILSTPKEYIDFPIGLVEKYDEEFIKNLLPKPKINMNGSYYCKNSKMSEEKDLGLHDYRYNIINVEIVHNDKRKYESIS